VVRLLLDHTWVRLEAERRGLTVSTGAVLTRVRKEKARSFPRERDYERFLASSGHSLETIKAVVRSDLRLERVQADVTRRAKTERGKARLFERFTDRYHARWERRTVCGQGFAIDPGCGSVVPTST
jgi:foldase protein PrsA